MCFCGGNSGVVLLYYNCYIDDDDDDNGGKNRRRKKRKYYYKISIFFSLTVRCIIIYNTYFSLYTNFHRRRTGKKVPYPRELVFGIYTSLFYYL